MRSHHSRARQLAALTALAAFCLTRAGLAETVDDAFLVSTSVKPNVILIFDNSIAMNHIEWHPAFNPATAPTCAGIDPNTDYAGTGNNETYCGNTRRMYKVTNPGAPPTLWNGKYLAWYYSLSTAVPAENQILNDIATSVVTVAACNSAGSGTRYTAQFRRTRADAMRQVFFDVLCLSEPKGLRLGLGLFRAPAEAVSPKVDPNGGFIAAAVDDNTAAHASDLEAQIGNTKIDDPATPLTEAVFQFYTYLMPRVVGQIPFGKDGATRFPKYVYNKFGDDSSASGGPLADPVQQACQKNYMILVTGGLATRDDFDQDPATTSQGFNDFVTLVGDYYAEGDTEVPGTANESTLYLDDLTKYMHEHDLRPDYTDDQTVDFYTVGFGTTAADNAYLRRASETVGGGLHFTAQDGNGLSQALLDALNNIVEKSRSFTAATVPSARTADGGDFYNSFFLPSDRTAFWEGHLRAWHFTAAGEIVDRDDHCALVDPDGGSECNDGPFQVICETGQSWPACVNPFWDAGEATLVALDPGATGSNSDTNARQLYTSKLIAGAPALVDFDMSLTRADLKLLAFTVNGTAGTPADPSPNSNTYTIAGSQALNADGLADEVVAYGRGCFFGTGVTGANIQPAPDGQKPCAERGWVIGDIFHSDPIVVRNPADRPFGTAYDAFKTTYAARDRVIYTGTNGGYLEAFHAGDWVSSPAPGKYDEGSGVEMFGFMPWEARTKIKNQPIDSPSNRTHYVDGAPQAADAWFYSTATSATQQESDWHTVLAGGLREGGRHYYAIDVTNSSKLTGAGKPAYPDLLWEFPNEADFNSGAGDYVNMGETWGQPIMTRVRLRVCNPTCNDNGGQGFERWVVIVSGGYDATSDPNSVSVDPTKAAYSATATKGRALYMLDAKTGEVIAQQKVGTPGAPPALNTGTVQNQMQYSLVSTPAVLDIDADGFADVVYIGDLRGNVFKWVIKAVGEDRVNDGTGLRTQPAWKFLHFFQAASYTGSPGTTKYYRNIFQPPSAAYVSNKLWLAFGTGERASIGFTDRLTDGDDPADATPDDEDHVGAAGSPAEENRFYAINDPDPLGTAATAPNVVTEADLSDLTVVGTTVTSTRGYWFAAENAEKFVTSTVIFAGKVITASFTPSQIQPGAPGWDPCSQRGDGKLYIFDLKSGAGVFEDGAGDEQRYVDIGSGLPTDPKISIGVGGDDNKIVIQQSGTEVKVIDAEDVSYGRGIIYWREMH